jgi:mono/diheme cytochrome c family protein
MRAFLPSTILGAAIICTVVSVSLTRSLPTVSADSSAKQRGAELFAQEGCAHCHGPAGVGGGKGPDLQLVRKRLNEEQITKQIHDGGLSMPAFKDSLTDPQIADLVAYLRARRKFVKVPATPHPAPAPTTPTDSDPD